MQKTKLFSMFVAVIVVSIIVPQMVLAAWWNPFSWNWGRLLSIFQKQTQIEKQVETNTNTNDSKTETPKDQTAGWKTYTNTQYGFEFKYPKTWTISDDLTLNTCCLDVSNYDPIKKQNERLEKGEVTIQIANYKKSASVSLKDFVSSKTYMESDIKATSVENVNIAGINGIKSNLIGDGTYYLPHSSTEGISIIIFNHSESKNNFKETTNQILSTFKFTPVK